MRIVGLLTFDITQNPWRRGDVFDAIVTDPPCLSDLHACNLQVIHHFADGVRAGAKCLGRKNPEKRLNNRSPHREQISQLSVHTNASD